MAAHHAVRCALLDLDEIRHGQVCTTQRQFRTFAVEADAPAPALIRRKQVGVRNPAVYWQFASSPAWCIGSLVL